MLANALETSGTAGLAAICLIALVFAMYQLLATTLDRLSEQTDAELETQDDFHVSLQRNRETQERMSR